VSQLRSAWLVVLALVAGCTTAAPGRRSEALKVRVAGCAEQRGEVCELGASRTLTLWVGVPDAASLVVEVDGARAEATRQAIHHGTRLTLELPRDARGLRMSSHAGEFRLELGSTRELPELERARALMRSGDLSAAAALAHELAANPDPELAARALGLAGRVELRRGDLDAALARLERGSRAAQALGLRATAARDLLAMAFIHEYERFAPDEARRVLAKIEPDLHELQLDVLYHRAVIAYLTGDARDALDLAARVELESERLDDRVMLLQMGEISLFQLAELGRFAELRTRRDALTRLVGDDPCEQARLAVNLAWIELRAQSGDTRRARSDSERAARIHATTCADVLKRQNALLNVAFADWKLGDYRRAQAELAEALALAPTRGWLRAWVFELEGRLALAEKRDREALRIYRELAERADFALSPAARFRAEVGIGRALVALGELEGAAEAFARAEQSLDDELAQVPLAEGRDTFVGERDESARHLVDVLLALQRPERALEAARRARARALRTLALRSQLGRDSSELAQWQQSLSRYQAVRSDLLEGAREAWSIPLADVARFRAEQAARRRDAELALDQAFAGLAATEAQHAPPAPGEVIWLAQPLPEGWALFAQTDTATHVARIAALPAGEDEAALSASLLQPFATLLASAHTLRVIPYGPLKSVDFHALPWQGGVLLDSVAVVYGSDLGGRTLPEEPARSALVVADPGSDLPHARSEGTLVGTTLPPQLARQVLVGGEATHDALLARLPEVDLFHFAGHADFVSGGWQSGLRLAGTSHLEPGDILALPRVPRQVVLSGCETMRESADVSVASLGIAQAFLARGARSVVATTRPVPDALGVVLSRALLAPGRVSLDAQRFRDALREVRAHPSAGADWASYRLLVP
jgi:tetratricopeptide (TPR) repeat protein